MPHPKSIVFNQSQIRQERRSNRRTISHVQAYIIEVFNRTAGIVTADERGYSFFSSERAFDSMEGQHFASARDAERAARALVTTSGGRPRRAS